MDASRPAQRAAEQAVRLPPGGALTGWASLHLQDATYLDGLAPDGTTLLPVPSRSHTIRMRTSLGDQLFSSARSRAARAWGAPRHPARFRV